MFEDVWFVWFESLLKLTVSACFSMFQQDTTDKTWHGLPFWHGQLGRGQARMAWLDLRKCFFSSRHTVFNILSTLFNTGSSIQFFNTSVQHQYSTQFFTRSQLQAWPAPQLVASEPQDARPGFSSCSADEYEDFPEVLVAKAKQLADLLRRIWVQVGQNGWIPFWMTWKGNHLHYSIGRQSCLSLSTRQFALPPLSCLTVTAVPRSTPCTSKTSQEKLLYSGIHWRWHIHGSWHKGLQHNVGTPLQAVMKKPRTMLPGRRLARCG